jgi:hypothetical protein
MSDKKEIEEKPSAEQIEEWKQSRFHEDDGTSRGSFGGPRPAKKGQPGTERKRAAK